MKQTEAVIRRHQLLSCICDKLKDFFYLQFWKAFGLV